MTADGTQIAAVLRQLADACARDDERATSAPWIWTDEILLWNQVIDHCVLEHAIGHVQWPVTPEDRETIAAARNRLPELVRVLREAASCLAVQAALLAERATLRDEQHRRIVEEIVGLLLPDYVATLTRERDDLAARNAVLERALAEALDIADYETADVRSVPRRNPEHLARLPQLRAVLAGNPV